MHLHFSITLDIYEILNQSHMIPNWLNEEIQPGTYEPDVRLTFE